MIIRQNLINLFPEKQGEVLGFISFLQACYEKEQASIALHAGNNA